MEHKILITRPSADYELIDSGEGEKLERYGAYILRRPDPQALWRRHKDLAEWEKAQAVFSRTAKNAGWRTREPFADKWQIELAGVKFWIRPTAFKHTGVFPEQAGNWEWLRSQVKSRGGATVLNLFGYTGGATLALALGGAEVCHVDGSKTALGWARDNAELNGLSHRPVRWILDDAVKFVCREIKRGRHYDGIVMDPPAFGHGPKGEMWRIEKDFLTLMDRCEDLLSPRPLFILVNGYASGYSAVAYENNLMRIKEKFGGEIEKGELTIAESGDHGRLLPGGIFARWSLPE